jgi:hypothetical protein
MPVVVEVVEELVVVQVLVDLVEVDQDQLLHLLGAVTELQALAAVAVEVSIVQDIAVVAVVVLVSLSSHTPPKYLKNLQCHLQR